MSVGSKRHLGLLNGLSVVLLAMVALVTMVPLVTSTDQAAASTPSVVTSQTLMAGQLWMIKSNDLATIGGLGSYEWVGCGLTTAPLTASNYSPCKPGQVPIFTDYSMFQTAVSSGELTRGDTVIFDNETWVYTPAWEQAQQIHYEQLAAQLAAENGITFINTPYEAASPGPQMTTRTLDTIIADDVGAAKYASVVEIQAQILDKTPRIYGAFVRKAVKAIRAVNPNVPIIAGLATDAGGIPVSAKNMYQEYKYVRRIVQGFWLNANTWGTHSRGCAPQGCPDTARSFLKMIGVSG